jgi:hypothetical protein
MEPLATLAVEPARIGNLKVSRLVLGGNPLSGISHQGSKMDAAMKHYFTTQKIKNLLRQAETLGINTLVARADNHIIRTLMEYWDEGGTIQWIAQTCPEYGGIEVGVQHAIHGGAKACYIHGGQMDFLKANNKLDDVPAAIARIKEAGLLAGIAGHTPGVFEWAELHLQLDFYMCSYYNPSSRDQHAQHVSDAPEWFKTKDRDIMAGIIRHIGKPAIHYKVMAGGRNQPQEAFAFVARHMRANDVVCVGVYPREHPEMLAENARWLTEALASL